MNFLSSLGSAVLSASSAALHQAQGGIPGVQGYLLGDKVHAYEGKSIWSCYSGTKKDDQSPVTVFSFDLSSPSSSSDRRSLLPLARNSLRKLRALRHPNILKFLDGSESDSAVWIVTEPVVALSSLLDSAGALSEEAKLYGLLHVCTALGFLNKDGQSVHGGLRTTSVWVTPGGEWKLGGMEVCSRIDEQDGTMWNYGGLLPDSRTHAPPEVRKGGWTALKEYDPSTLDSYLLHLFLYTLFNGPLPSSFLTSDPPSLPQTRGSLPPALFQPWRRLGNPNPAARLKTSAFLALGQHPAEGWWPQNRLVKLAAALEGFALASENEKAGLIRTLKAISAGAASAKTDPLPSGFLKYKVLPSLVHSFEFGGGAGAAQLLPVILGLAGGGEGMDEKEYQRDVVQPIVRMYATPDRAVRMALLENLERYIDKVGAKDVVERVWPHLLTGFGDVVPVIREATVKSILLIAPKLNDRILNNDLLRHLSKTQTDTEPGIRTNTCILLSRLSPHLNATTQRKVLIPAFARALRDPFVHARIAGLMALMATAEVFEKEDLAGKVIPAMSICLVDREKTVRDQAFKAIDMFVKKCEALTASMPDTALPPPDPTASPSLATSPAAQQNTGLAAQAASATQPGIATSATGAAGALAGWAFASVSKKLSATELAAPIERRDSGTGATTPVLNGAGANGSGATPRVSTDSLGATIPSLPGGFDRAPEDWGGDLMDVENDDADWDEFESGQQPARSAVVDPLAARLSASKPKPSALGGAKRGGALQLGKASRSSALRVPMDMDATDSWDLDDDSAAPSASPAKPKPSPIPRAAAPSARTAPILPPGGVKKPTAASASLLAAAAAPPPPPPAPLVVIEPSPPPSPAAPVPPASLPPSPLPPAATPPSAPIPPSLPVLPPPAPVSPGPSPAVIPLPVSPAPSSPAASQPGTPTLAAAAPAGAVPGSMAGLSKEEKKAALERAREERRRRMAEAKAKR